MGWRRCRAARRPSLQEVALGCHCCLRPRLPRRQARTAAPPPRRQPGPQPAPRRPRRRPWPTMRRRRRLRMQRGIGLRHPAEPGRPGEPWARGSDYVAGNRRLCVKYATGHGHTVTARCGLRLRREKLMGHCVGPGPWAAGSCRLSLAVLICDARRSGGAHAAVAEAAEHCAQAYAANVTSGQSRQTGPTGAVCLIKDPTLG